MVDLIILVLVLDFRGVDRIVVALVESDRALVTLLISNLDGAVTVRLAAESRVTAALSLDEEGAIVVLEVDNLGVKAAVVGPPALMGRLVRLLITVLNLREFGPVVREILKLLLTMAVEVGETPLVLGRLGLVLGILGKGERILVARG